MEMADGLIITKADGNNIDKAKAARSEYARALHFLPPHSSGWIPEVKVCSSYDNYGISEAVSMIEKYLDHQYANGYFKQKRNEQNLHAFQRLLNDQLRQLLYARPGLKEEIRLIEKEILNNTISPYTAVKNITLKL
jgi:LAO/AO transport system kinase